MRRIEVLAERHQRFQVPARLAKPLSGLFALAAAEASTAEAAAASTRSSTTVITTTTATKSAPAAPIPVAERPANRSKVELRV